MKTAATSVRASSSRGHERHPCPRAPRARASAISPLYHRFDMYVPPAFREDRPDVIEAFLRAHPLATVVTSGAPGVLATPVPLLLEDGVLHGHVARANPHWRDLQGDALAIFHGPDFYVTPRWYAEKERTGRVVPTWNYIAVHVYGEARTWDDTGALRSFLERLTAAHEGTAERPWHVSDAPHDYIENLLGAIVGFSITIRRIEGKWKLNQNRSDADRAGVIAGLEGAGAGGHADLMRGGSDPNSGGSS